MKIKTATLKLKELKQGWGQIVTNLVKQGKK